MFAIHLTRTPVCTYLARPIYRVGLSYYTDNYEARELDNTGRQHSTLMQAKSYIRCHIARESK